MELFLPLSVKYFLRRRRAFVKLDSAIAGVRLLTAPEITNQRNNEMSRRGPYHKRNNINETNFPFSSGLREFRDGAAPLTGVREKPETKSEKEQRAERNARGNRQVSQWLVVRQRGVDSSCRIQVRKKPGLAHDCQTRKDRARTTREARAGECTKLDSNDRSHAGEGQDGSREKGRREAEEPRDTPGAADRHAYIGCAATLLSPGNVGVSPHSC